MKPERYRRLQELFGQAVELDPPRRDDFLNRECSGDLDLRRQVEDLLAKDSAATALPEPLRFDHVAAAMGSDLVGRTVRHYRIQRELGRGGMGVVYLAEDLNLGRPVALKFLAAHLAGTAEFSKRFLQEARAAATLDHPNICTIYETGDSEAGPFIAMAFLEGETIRARIEDGPLPIREALDWATQTALGLEAAHRRNIVHRDIKPENLIATPPTTGAGRALVKILDFGVARIAGETLTGAGSAPGTISYMAPEQFNTADADARCDVWALGVVLFEMVSGRKPFRSSSRALAEAILHTQPPGLCELRPDVPPELERIVNKALEKAPERRYQSVTAMMVDLTALQEALGAGTSATKPATARARSVGSWLIVAATVAAVAAAWYWRPSTETAPTVLAAQPLTHYLGNEEQPAISPDGRQVAFIWDGEEGSGDGDLYVQLIGSANPLRLTHTPEREHSPAWSPDGKRIAFMRSIGTPIRHSVLMIDALGGPETELNTSWVENAKGLSWSPDGEKLAYPTSTRRGRADGRNGLGLLSLEGRSSVDLTRVPDALKGGRDESPRFSPDGNRIAFIRWSAGLGEVRIVPSRGGESELVTSGPIRDAAWSADGASLLFAVRSGFSGKLQRIRLRGGSVEDVPLGESNVQDVEVRGDSLAFTHWRFNTVIWSAALSKPRNGSPRMAGGAARKVITSTRRQDSPQFSPDGNSIAFVSDRSGSEEIWRCDREGDSLRQLTFMGNAGTPRWSPDGRSIAFDSLGPTPGNVEIYVVSADGGEPKRITNNPGQDRVPSWSRDGKWIYFGSNRSGDRRVWKTPADGGAATQVTKQPGFEAIESPDGRRLYYSKGTHVAGIWSLDFETGEEAAVPELADAGFYRYWTSSKTGFYFVNAHADAPADKAWDVRRLDYNTGRIDVVGRIQGKLDTGKGGLVVSPDDATLLFLTVEVNDKDIMLVEVFK